MSSPTPSPFPPRDVRPEVAERQTLRYREMSPTSKLALADALWDLAWDATKAGVRQRQPHLDAAAVDAQARQILRNAAD
ncbi:MAG: hypothetical protein H0X64_03890 [Gemmatimonadaceae bacterium]|nr:hypothetical protein [Gemmatimonadaceae bacterium]